jgi:pSer/pThr/pTyr-binding forkhead associated (FHA) protein
VLDVDGVSGFHAEIVEDQGQFYLVDLDSSNGTLLDGQKVSGRVALRAWQKLTFDEVEAELVDPAGRRPTAVRKAVGANDVTKGATSPAMPQGPLVLSFKSGGSADFKLDKVKVSIGRDPQNDVVIDKDGISGFHAQITEDQGRLYLVDLGSTNGTSVDGQRVNVNVELRAWQVIAFDEIEVELVDPSGRRPTVARRAVGAPQTSKRGPRGTEVMPAVSETLKIVKGPGDGQSFTLKGERMTIGRTEDNDIVLDAETVSSLHATLLKEKNGWTLIDEGSTNGTFVNRKRVERRTLSNDTTISMGEVDLLYSQVRESRYAARRSKVQNIFSIE